MENFYKFDLSIYAMLLLVVLQIIIWRHSYGSSRSNRLCSIVVIATFIALGVEILSWIYEGDVSPNGRRMHRIYNTILYLQFSFPAVAWVLYFEYKTFGERHKTKVIVVSFVIVFFLAIILVVINHFNGMIFGFSPMNHFEKGPLGYLMAILAYGPVLFYVLSVIIRRKYADERIIKTVVTICIVPISAFPIQMNHLGLTIIWPSLTLVILVTYILFETDSLQKDDLTGLYTRKHLEKRVKYLLSKKQEFSIVMIDLDRFKSVNDTYGHPVGDQVLKVVSSIILSNVKRRDEAFRIGGDEFILLVQEDNKTGGISIGNRLKEEIRVFNRKEFLPFEISMTFGVYHSHSNTSETYSTIMTNVDKKMYEKKKA